MHPENIIKVKYVGVQETVDIEVGDRKHVFYANSIATSNSHGIEYSLNSHMSMAAKVYFPTAFYCAWLTFSKEKIDPKEAVAELVQDARMHDVKVLPPDIREKNADFKIMKEKEIRFGLSHIRGVGESAIKSILNEEIGTLEHFINSAKKLKKNVAEALVKSGACDFYKVSRTYMLRLLHVVYGRNNTSKDELSELKSLTDKELNYFRKNVEISGVEKTLIGILDNNICTKARRPIIERKIKVLQNVPADTKTQKSIWEKIYLGLNLTCSAADDFEKRDNNVKTCKQVFDMPYKQKASMHVVIDSVSVRKTSEKSKTPGREYCILKVSDNSGAAEIIAWPEKFDRFSRQFVENGVVSVQIYKDSWNGRNQLLLNNCVLIG